MFNGFSPPSENWVKLPTVIINRLSDFSSKSELVCVLYILRHTWGYQNFGGSCRISLDEFENGRKNSNGDRLDSGVGMSKPSIVSGLKSAIDNGYIICLVDNVDKGRITHYYSLRMEGLHPGYTYAIDPNDSDAHPFWHDLPQETLTEAYNRSEGRCAYCDARVPHWHYNHIIPIDSGGTDDVSNIVLSCPVCAISKGNKTPSMWGHHPYFYEGGVKKLYGGGLNFFTGGGKEILHRTYKDNINKDNEIDSYPDDKTSGKPFLITPKIPGEVLPAEVTRRRTRRKPDPLHPAPPPPEGNYDMWFEGLLDQVGLSQYYDGTNKTLPAFGHARRVASQLLKSAQSINGSRGDELKIISSDILPQMKIWMSNIKGFTDIGEEAYIKNLLDFITYMDEKAKASQSVKETRQRDNSEYQLRKIVGELKRDAQLALYKTDGKQYHPNSPEVLDKLRAMLTEKGIKLPDHFDLTI